MTNMSIQPLWLTHFIEILLVLEFQLTKFIVGTFSYKAHFRYQISSNVRELWVRWLQDPTKGDLKIKLTHIDRDKGGHEAHVLEASRVFSFSIFTKGTTFFPLWHSGLGENHSKNTTYTRWHRFSITGIRRWWIRYRSLAKGKRRCSSFFM